MNTVIQLIKDQLIETYNGDPWYGRSILSILNEVTAASAWNARSSKDHTNIILLRHMINWRQFTISRFENAALKNTEYFDTNNWQSILNCQEKDWLTALDDLASSQKELLEMISLKTDDFLDGQVPGRSYNFSYLLLGIIQHDIYHIGQIMVSLK